MIDGPFAEVTGRIQARISDRTARADAAVFRATLAMIVLAAAALGAQSLLGGRAERHLGLLMDRLAEQISSGLEDSASAAERVASGDLESAVALRPGGTMETVRTRVNRAQAPRTYISIKAIRK